MNVGQLRGWLLQQPKPSLVRVTDDAGAQHEIDPTGMSWARIAESVQALHPELVQALGPNGKLIRACRPGDVDEDDSSPSPSSSSSKRSTPATLPSVADLEPFARMLADAYRHSTSMAFDKLVELYNASNERLLALERMQQREMERKERELEQREEALAEQAEQQGKGGLVEEMIGAFVGGAGGAAPAPNGTAKPNGKG